MAHISEGFVHTVFFWLKDNSNQAHKEALHEGLKKLAQIPEIKTAYIGQPASTRREVIDSSYDFSISFVFVSAADQEIYQVHADHLKFIENCSYLWSSVKVYDAC
jgi:Stress responsive A/B Barrel Domain